MTAFLIFILVAIIVMTLVTLACFMAGYNHVRCPNCGSDMEYLGDDDTFGVPNGLPKPLKHHYYICPKCGRTKIV